MNKHLSKDRHPQRDFFVACLSDVSPRGDIASMEHPVFALKAGDKRVRHYEHNGNTLTVKPGHDGLATIHDKDLWIYCISQLVAAQNAGISISRTVRFTAYDFLVTTNRSTGGRGYKLLSEMMERLSGTRLETDIHTDGQREREWFGLIDSAKVVEKDKDERMVAVEVTLPDWLFRAVEANEVLSISPDYFRLRKPLDRRIYELARKHCGKQPKWRVSTELLHKKTGSSSQLKKFRLNIKSLADTNELPDYSVQYDQAADMVTFYHRRKKGKTLEQMDLIQHILDEAK